MSVAAERMIATDDAHRAALLAAAERVEVQLQICFRNLADARRALKAAREARELVSTTTPYIVRMLRELEVAYDVHRVERDRLYVLQGACWAALERHDAAAAAAAGVPHIAHEGAIGRH